MSPRIVRDEHLPDRARVDFAKVLLEDALDDLEKLGCEYADARRHTREAIGLIDAAQEVDR